jgi:hypothetical protein
MSAEYAGSDASSETNSDTSKPWPQEAVRKIHQLEMMNRKLKADLDRSLANLMKLQGEKARVTDDDIQSRFAKLYDNIRYWVLNVQRDLKRHGWDFKEVFQNARQGAPGKPILEKLLQNDPSASATAAKGDDIAWLKWAIWLGQHTTCIRVILSLVIWEHIEEKIFHSSFPIGIPPRISSLFKDIMEVMAATGDGQGTYLGT